MNVDLAAILHHLGFQEIGRVARAALHAKKALRNAPGQLLSMLRL